jgi:hypothetical protein
MVRLGFGRYALGVGLAVVLLAGCGGQSGTPGAVPVGNPVAKQGLSQVRSWMKPKVNPRHPWLYVSDTAANAIYVYNLGKSGATLIGEITTGLNGPFGMAVDKSGYLYVANQGTPGNVTIYPPGKTSPSLTLSQDLTTPQGVAVNSTGDVYVMNRGNTPGIAVYPAGSSQPSGYITSNLIQNPIQDFFDGAGNLYFSDPNSGVSEIPKGSQQQPVSLGLNGLTHAGGIALAPSGNLYVNDYRPNEAYIIHVYALGKTRPKYNLKDNLGGYYLASGSIGFRDYVFVPDWFSDRVFLYRDASKKLYSVIDTPGNNTGGVAFKPAGVP